MKDLMIQRYEVIGEWPDMLERFSVGYVFEHPYGRQYLTAESKYDPADYPHLFRKLEWWEKRTVEEMPGYVKDTSNDKVYKVLGKECDNRMFGHNDTELEQRTFLWWLKNYRKPLVPATETEYNDTNHP